MRPFRSQSLFYCLVPGLFLLMSAPRFLHAQDTEYFDGERQFYGGLVLGLNASQVDGDGFAGFHKPGLNVGATVFWHFTPSVALQLDLLYSQKGSRGVRNDNDPYVGSYFERYTMQLNYAEVPVLIHYVMSQKYQFGIGASYNALIKGSEQYQMANPVYIDPALYPFNKYFIDGIASFNMMLYKGLMANVRYQYAITPVRNFEHTPYGVGTGHQINKMIAVRLSYLF